MLRQNNRDSTEVSSSSSTEGDAAAIDAKLFSSGYLDVLVTLYQGKINIEDLQIVKHTNFNSLLLPLDFYSNHTVLATSLLAH